MNFWTPRIALIAYVLGGWFLPALHHHDHSHSAHQHGTGCNESCVDATPVVSSSDDSECGCCESHGKANASSLTSPTDSDYEATHSQENCVGLCSLCVAASMAADTVERVSSSIGSMVMPSSATIGGQVWPAQPLLCGVSSRGPPVCAY